MTKQEAKMVATLVAMRDHEVREERAAVAVYAPAPNDPAMMYVAAQNQQYALACQRQDNGRCEGCGQ